MVPADTHAAPRDLLVKRARLQRLADRAVRRFGPIVLYGLLCDVEGVDDALARATNDPRWIEGEPIDLAELERIRTEVSRAPMR